MYLTDIYRSLGKDDRLIISQSQVQVISKGVIARTYLACNDGNFMLTNTEIPSNPPSGNCQITNIYWDPVSKKAVFEYENTPIP